MSFGKKSREHHWWPIGIQKEYWADKSGNVSWVTPEGELDSKRNYKRIGMKLHGHTFATGSPWKTNFEEKFDSADNNVHRVITSLQGILPPPPTLRFSLRVLGNLIKRSFHPNDLCRYTHIPDGLHRQTLLLINSLLIRSPAKRHQFEHYTKLANKKSRPSEEVGKGNMRTAISAAIELYEKGNLCSQFFVILHSPRGGFVYGDGMYDRLTNDLFRGVPIINGKPAQPTISGKALVPLTPELCVYFSTPKLTNNTINCASLKAEKWMVESVNELVQIHSCERIFYRGERPKITSGYKMKDFGLIDDKNDSLISFLDEIAIGGETSRLP